MAMNGNAWHSSYLSSYHCPLLLRIQKTQGLWGSKQGGTHHVCSIPSLLYQHRKHRLVPTRDKKAGSVHCYGSEGQINVTLKYSLRSFNDLAKNMASHCFSSTSAAVYVHTLY